MIGYVYNYNMHVHYLYENEPDVVRRAQGWLKKFAEFYISGTKLLLNRSFKEVDCYERICPRSLILVRVDLRAQSTTRSKPGENQ